MENLATKRRYEEGGTSLAAACAQKLIWRVSRFLVLTAGVFILMLGHSHSLLIIGSTGTVWVLTTALIQYFFRDPEPDIPTVPNVFIAPAHGLIHVIDETADVPFMGERCRRISIFLSVLDVHVQYAPAAGKVMVSERTPGRFYNALKTQSARCNENVLIGIDCEQLDGERVAVRQIAGAIARRIMTCVDVDDSVEAGQRIGLIQFGSRCDLYLPLSAQLRVRPGDRVVGGETVIGTTARCSGVQPLPHDYRNFKERSGPGEHVSND